MGLFGDKNKKSTGRKPGFNSSPKGFVSAAPVAPPTPSKQPTHNKGSKGFQGSVDPVFPEWGTHRIANANQINDAKAKFEEAKDNRTEEEKERASYVEKFEGLKALEAEGLSPAEIGTRAGLHSERAFTEVRNLLGFATVSEDNPDYNNGSLISRLAPKKITHTKSYVITLYGGLKDSLPDSNEDEMFKEIGHFSSITLGHNTKTGEDGLLVKQEYTDKGLVDIEERFVPKSQISYVNYEV